MQLKNIYEQAWRVSPHLEITHNALGSLEPTEQECHLNIMKEGYSSKDPEITVCCSYQTYITKLAKSTRFLLQKILVSNSPTHKDFVLQITGRMKKGDITIRK